MERPLDPKNSEKKINFPLVIKKKVTDAKLTDDFHRQSVENDNPEYDTFKLQYLR